MLDIPWLDKSIIHFPPVDQALSDPNGLLAVGGDLSPERLIYAYRRGIFPWFESGQPILWWSPSPRTVLFPSRVRISRSLRKTHRKQQFVIRGDSAFKDVIENCAHVPRKDQQGTWITPEMRDAYCNLYDLGVAHSVETWLDGKLVGGLYGLAIGKVFFGESMFSHTTDASKIAFIYLAKQLQCWEFAMIDCQVSNPHLFSLGAEEIERKRFSQLLAENIDKCSEQSWQGEWERLNL